MQRRDQLAKRRREAGFSQEALAERLQVSRSTIARWERGEVEPHPRHRLGLADALGVPAVELSTLFVADLNTADSPPPNQLAGVEVDRQFAALSNDAFIGQSLSSARVLDELTVQLGADRGGEEEWLVGQGLDSVGLDLDSLTQALVLTKQAYQDCDYHGVARYLLPLLHRLETAEAHVDEAAELWLAALSAQAYHVAGSILFKLGEQDVATTAALLSMQAARRCQDPTVVCSSGRIVTQALTSTGHPAAAVEFAGGLAHQLETSVSVSTSTVPLGVGLSVYGSLLLRGAMAASQHEDAESASDLLDEADRAAKRLGGDYNYDWTAFGPTNVQAHRVAAEVNLGNAGSAVRNFEHINIHRLGTAERKATVLVDAGRAYTQWGKYEQAVDSLWQASELAPQELSRRPVVQQVVTDMRALAPPSEQPLIAHLADRVGFD